mgnify:CR=1 FL=1
MRILLTGESTAGNLAPLIAVYQALTQKTAEENVREKVEFKLISTESEMLRTFVQGRDMDFDLLNPGRENGKSDIFTSIKNFTRIMLSVYDYMPDVIFLKGGFVSLPVARAKPRMDQHEFGSRDGFSGSRSSCTNRT